LPEPPPPPARGPAAWETPQPKDSSTSSPLCFASFDSPSIPSSFSK